MSPHHTTGSFTVYDSTPSLLVFVIEPGYLVCVSECEAEETVNDLNKEIQYLTVDAISAIMDWKSVVKIRGKNWRIE
jgi:hypothetical protein